jgi:hypothetical protein
MNQYRHQGEVQIMFVGNYLEMLPPNEGNIPIRSVPITRAMILGGDPPEGHRGLPKRMLPF